MIKEALQYIVSGMTGRTVTEFGQVFTSEKLEVLPQARPAALTVHNLSGLCDYIAFDFDKQPPVLIQVESPTEVNVYSTFNRDMKRNHLLRAEALLPKIGFEQFLSLEAFNVLLQSCFVPTDYRAAVLAVVGNVTENNVTNIGDDGVTQQVTAKAGIATVDNIKVPNPVFLKPFRTFVDIEQPESQFVFRMRRGNGDSPTAALFEADGGAWKLAAIHSIRDYLTNTLADEVESGRVTIIA